MKGSVPASGITLVELLVVLATLGILLSLGPLLVRAPDARLFSNDIKILIQQARHEAIKRNRPVAVLWTNSQFTTRLASEVGPTITNACSSNTIINTKSALDYRNISVTANNFGIVWLPNGIGQPCPSRSFGNLTVTDGRVTRTVQLSTAGGVRIQ
jgi:Tfp pilus assembly protein FimT